LFASPKTIMAVSTDELRTVYTASDRGAVAAANRLADADDRIDAAARRALRSQAQLMRVKASYNNAFVTSGRAAARLSAFQSGGRGGGGRPSSSGGGGGGSAFSGVAASFGVMGRAAGSAFGIIRSGFSMAMGLARGLAVGVGVAAGAFVLFATGAVKQAIAFDSLRRGLDAVAGSAAEGGKQWERLRELAKVPGLGFEEAVAGSIGLQSAGLSSGAAEKVMAAVARVNRGGSANFGGVMTQLIQTAGQGKLQGDEVNLISERLPMFRSAIRNAFGTTDAKEINALGLTAEQMLSRVSDALNKMPSAGGGGILNAFDNIGDSWKFLLDAMGRAAFPFITTVLNTVAPFLEFLTESGTAAQVANGFISAIQGVVGNGGGIIGFFALFTAILLNLPTILSRLGTFIGNLFTSLSTIFVNTYNTIGPVIVSLINLVGQAISSLNSLGGPGAVLGGVVAGAMLLKGGGAAALGLLGAAARGVVGTVGTAIGGGVAAIGAVGGAIGGGAAVATGHNWQTGWLGEQIQSRFGRKQEGAPSWLVGPSGTFPRPNYGNGAGPSTRGVGGSGGGGMAGGFNGSGGWNNFQFQPIGQPGNLIGQAIQAAGFGDVAAKVAADRDRLMAEFGAFKPGGGAFIPGGGGSPAERAQIETAKNTGVTATATRKLADLNRGALGGGELGKLGITAVSLSSFLKGRGEAPVVVNASHPGLKSFLEDIAEQVLSSRRRAEAF